MLDTGVLEQITGVVRSQLYNLIIPISFSNSALKLSSKLDIRFTDFFYSAGSRFRVQARSQQMQ